MPGRPRYSPARPGPVAYSFARYITERYDVEISPAQAQAMFSYHNEWQRWRNQPGGEAEQEKHAHDAHRSTTNASHDATTPDKPTRRHARPGTNGANGDPAFCAAKLARIREPHVAPLNELADEIADAKGLPRGSIPYVDPDCRGVHAHALALLDNPSTRAKAGTGSGLLSLDNDDRTARNLREAYARHHIDRSNTVGWNAVPFPVINSNGGSTRAERREGAPWLREFVRRCPNLKVVMLLGRAAEDGWALAGLTGPFEVVTAPHPSARGLNSYRGRERFDNALACLARTLDNE